MCSSDLPSLRSARLQAFLFATSAALLAAFSLPAHADPFGWGSNVGGALGDGTNLNQPTPVVADLSGVLAGKSVVAISGGQLHTVALTSEGKLYAWGNNGSAELGDGTNTSRSTPVAVDMSGVLAGKTVTAIDGGAGHTVALTSDGKIYAWGFNDYGQLGDGTFTNRTTPVAVDLAGVLAGKTVTAISASAYHTVALTSDGKAYAWGYNYAGALGDGSTTDRPAPVTVDMTGVLAGKTLTAISAGGYHTVALTTDGKAYA